MKIHYNILHSIRESLIFFLLIFFKKEFIFSRSYSVLDTVHQTITVHIKNSKHPENTPLETQIATGLVIATQNPSHKLNLETFHNSLNLETLLNPEIPSQKINHKIITRKYIKHISIHISVHHKYGTYLHPGEAHQCPSRQLCLSNWHYARWNKFFTLVPAHGDEERGS